MERDSTPTSSPDSPIEIEIKEASLECAALVHAAIPEFEDGYTLADFWQRCQGHRHLVLVSYLGEQLAGYLIAYDRDRDGSFYCWMAGVHPLHRRLGVLTALMGYVSAWAREHGYTKLKIKTRNRHRGILTYLIKSGFMVSGFESQPDILENRIDFEKNL